jgi:hypothetical protein
VVFENLAKISTPIFAHARKFPFNLNVNFNACAKIVVEIFARFPKTAVCHKASEFSQPSLIIGKNKIPPLIPIQLLYSCLFPLT